MFYSINVIPAQAGIQPEARPRRYNMAMFLLETPQNS
jgi:hypothetical protein